MRSSRAPSRRSRRTASQGRSSASRVSWRWCRGTNNSVAFKSYSSWWLNGTPSGRPGRSSKTRRVQGGEVRPELEALLALQEKDQAVMGADAALATVEPEVRVLDEALAAAEQALAAARREIEREADRGDELEGKIASYRTMQEQRRQRLEWVRGAKEASTLMAELDLARSVLAKEEAEFMRSGDAVTEAERRAAEAEQALAKVRAQQAAEREALVGRREQIAGERERAVAEREQAAARVTPAMLARYERIRRGKAPLALYPLHVDACGHCFTAVPTQRRTLIQRGVSIEACEACGVLLYAKE